MLKVLSALNGISAVPKIILMLLFLSCVSEAASSLNYKVMETLEHDPNIFVQGAVISQGVLYESGGKYGNSSIGSYSFPKLERKYWKKLNNQLFAEGIALVGDELLMLTWREQALVRFSLPLLKPSKVQKYQGEGWGLAYDGKQLWRSDGSDTLFVHEPVDFKQTGQVKVTEQGKSVRDINELEFIEGILLANIWQKNDILAICPANGQVLGRLKLGKLAYRHRRQGVLNGIAYWKEKKQLWVSGKMWNKAYLLDVDLSQVQQKCTGNESSH